jgi:predicted nucleotidyltransferase
MIDIKLSKDDQERLGGLGVITLYLFGSRALGVEGPLSDYDFGLLMNELGHRRGDDAYNAIYDILSPFCPRTLDNDVIDIIFLNEAPLELRSHVIRYGKIIFESQPLLRGEFETRTMLEASDFQPLQAEIDKTIIASL